jgi:hypothetical protein
MDMHRQDRAVHVFTVRVWLEPLSESEAEWRGRIQDVNTGETYYFREWSTLIEDLIAMLPDLANQPGEAGGKGCTKETDSAEDRPTA